MKVLAGRALEQSGKEPPVSSGPVLAIERLCKRYARETVLDDVNVSIDEGDFLVLVGPSGCGKSTLLNCIAGLIDVTSGEVRIAGDVVTHMDPASRNIAMVFQSYALFPNMSVEQNIGFGLEVRRVPSAERTRKIRNVASLLKIDNLLDRSPAQLSGGQRQRVAMARALVREPKLFLFDEPLSNLDAKLRVTMRTEIKRLHQRLGASIIYVTHDQVEAMTLATKIVVMKDGMIQQVGTPHDIYNRPANTFVADFMGAPAMNLMAAKVRLEGERLRIEIPRGKDQPPLVLYDASPPLSLQPSNALNVTVGLRPESITDVASRVHGAEQRADCVLDVVEPAGSDTFAVIDMGGTEVVARLHGDMEAKSGDMLTIAFDLSKISYFDTQNGLRL